MGFKHDLWIMQVDQNSSANHLNLKFCRWPGHISSKWRNGNLFSSKALRTIAGANIRFHRNLTVSNLIISFIFMIIRMNVTAGYKGVVGRTCKTDPNRCLFYLFWGTPLNSWAALDSCQSHMSLSWSYSKHHLFLTSRDPRADMRACTRLCRDCGLYIHRKVFRYISFSHFKKITRY